MRIAFLAASALIGCAIAAAAPARADIDFPYCSIAGFGVGQDCSFNTREQCQAKVRGTGTDCEANPRYVRTNAANSRQMPRR